jgi:hypothetical protein
MIDRHLCAATRRAEYHMTICTSLVIIDVPDSSKASQLQSYNSCAPTSQGWMTLLSTTLVLLLSLNVLANTEIVNFSPSEARVARVPFAEQWSVIEFAFGAK